jgi:hypothetical protein
MLQSLGMMEVKLPKLCLLSFILTPIKCNHGSNARSCNDDYLYYFTWFSFHTHLFWFTYIEIFVHVIDVGVFLCAVLL